MKSVVLITVLTCLHFLARSQQECRSFSYKQAVIAQSPQVAANIAAAESFTTSWIEKRKTSVNGVQEPGHGLTEIIIPVVVHVIYNSTNQNIADAQVRSQIDALNKDYQRLNDDTLLTPDVFRPFAVSCGFRFVLAGIDPAGRPTSGIVRKHSSATYFDVDDRIKFSAQGGDDAWDPSSYLNIWVGNLSLGVLGYSSVPGGAKEKDGVVIQYNSFGTRGSLVAPFNKGRTATHEIGHWLSLIHTWGDNNCGDDQVDDTPPQKGPNRSCPGAIRVTCGNGTYGDMYMNYMDFTDDACLNMFTQGQRDRMRSLFAPGGPRYSLLNSVAAVSSVNGVTEAPISPFDGLESGIRLFPNPAYGLVTVNNTAPVVNGSLMNVYNAMGQQVMSVKITRQKQDLDVSKLPRGIYYLKTDVNGNRQVARLVKM